MIAFDKGSRTVLWVRPQGTIKNAMAQGIQCQIGAETCFLCDSGDGGKAR